MRRRKPIAVLVACWPLSQVVEIMQNVGVLKRKLSQSSPDYNIDLRRRFRNRSSSIFEQRAIDIAVGQRVRNEVRRKNVRVERVSCELLKKLPAE